MKVLQSQATALFEILGFPTANKWSAIRMEKKIMGLPDVVDENTDAKDQQQLLDDLLVAIDIGEEIHVQSDVEEEAPKKKKTAKAKKAKEPKPKKVGIIATIIEVLNAASEKSPVTKQGILDVLSERFPERKPESMLRTVSVQVPTRLRVDKEIIVSKSKDGYWINESNGTLIG